MAASPTPRPADAEPGPALSRALAAAREGLGPLLAAPARDAPPAIPFPLAVALSGGADSTALLAAACLLAPGRVQAFHIHHGLQAAADGFAAHCEALCARWQVPLRVLRVQAGHAPGESPEDAARRARYGALARAAREAAGAVQVYAREGDAVAVGGPSDGAAGELPVRVWLGHHADDQAETLLLALSRGAGLPGLAAMPARFVREGVTFERPLLSVPGAELRSWLQGQGIGWIEDPTNADTAFTRNRIRHQLLPALATAFPQFRETFARSARHAAQAQSLLEEMAREDLAAATPAGADAAGQAPGRGSDALVIQRLQALSPARQANLLRHWLRAVHGQAASTVQLEELLAQVEACRTRGHRIRIRVGRGWVLREGALLHWLPLESASTEEGA